jgi:hypothetical protein
MDTDEPPEQLPEGQQVISVCGEAEAARRLPMRIAPLLVSTKRLTDVSESLLEDIVRDGVVLYGSMAHLAALASPRGLAPMVVFSYTLGKQATREKVQLHRRLFGYKSSARRRTCGLLAPPSRRLGPGVVLVPLTKKADVTRALREAGALFSEVPVLVAEGKDGSG